MSLPQITVFSLGGTISSGQQGEYGVVPSLEAACLISSVPQLAEVAEIDPINLRQVASPGITLNDVRELAEAIRLRASQGCEGVVVTQGTDTLEEVAFALDLVLDLEIPVVVTGAMRNPTLAGADGPANLLAAVLVAASRSAQGLGVLVVMNEEIHAARYVQKTHTQNAAAFSSSPLGPLGWVAEGKTRILSRPFLRRAAPPLSLDAENVAVALLTIGAFDDGRLVRAAYDLGFSGAVVQSLGGGHVPPWIMSDLGRLARTIPTILASRAAGGEVLRSTYGFPGSEIDLRAEGLIPAGYLTGVKARVLLMLLLGSGVHGEGVTDAFQLWQ